MADPDEPDPADRADVLDLDRALRHLSADERTLLALRYEAGLDSSEIGALLGRPSATIRWRLSRLRHPTPEGALRCLSSTPSTSGWRLRSTVSRIARRRAWTPSATAGHAIGGRRAGSGARGSATRCPSRCRSSSSPRCCAGPRGWSLGGGDPFRLGHPARPGADRHDPPHRPRRRPRPPRRPSPRDAPRVRHRHRHPHPCSPWARPRSTRWASRHTQGDRHPGRDRDGRPAGHRDGTYRPERRRVRSAGVRLGNAPARDGPTEPGRARAPGRPGTGSAPATCPAGSRAAGPTPA